jgi:hypothetical protein
MRQTPLLAALALLVGSAARADTVEASSSTFITSGQQTRYKGGTSPDLVTVAPAYEILTITDRDIATPYTNDLQLVLSTWGAVDLAERRWDAGRNASVTGDVTAGYVQAKLLDRHLTVRLGRETVTTGAAGMLQLDGGEVVVLVPTGGSDVRLSAYVGSPTSQRFQTRSGLKSWNHTGGDLAYGGRLAFALPVPGLAGRGLELGASANFVQDGGNPVRQEAAGDFRLQPFERVNLVLTGVGAYSLYDERFSQANVAAAWTVLPRLHVTADWKFVEPGLLLARNSVLSVFTASTWNEFGGGLRYDLGRDLHAGADYHLRLEPGTSYGTSHIGTDAVGRLDWAAGANSAGLELSYLDAYLNGYVGTRVYARRDLGRISAALGNAFVSADILAQYFLEKVNGEDAAVTATLSAGFDLPHGFSAVVSGRAGTTPYEEQTYDVMAKLAYNQTYGTKGVR